MVEDLPLILVRASIELCNYHSGKPIGFENIEVVKNLLNDSINNRRPKFFSNTDFDYPFMCVLSQSDDLKALTYGGNLDSFYLQFKLFHSELSHLEDLSEERFKRLNHTLCQLSDATAYRQRYRFGLVA